MFRLAVLGALGGSAGRAGIRFALVLAGAGLRSDTFGRRINYVSDQFPLSLEELFPVRYVHHRPSFKEDLVLFGKQI